MGEALGLKVEMLKADWQQRRRLRVRSRERLATDKNHEIKGVFTVHNETATGMMLPLSEVRRALDGRPSILRCC